jgi:hypothetical protein
MPCAQLEWLVDATQSVRRGVAAAQQVRRMRSARGSDTPPPSSFLRCKESRRRSSVTV